ncbi:basic secretory protease [Phtheirospermum japonicum]|uniref:Basic secretory protease n=1 Tax=Phtheirospermum japonicum TaxID=374723 RepID=A0A830BC13_9LAMI|nr:basic secretory protease [Phtheirospermum japonicum]
MQTINFFIWDIFQQYSYADRKNVETVKLFIQQFDGGEGYMYGEEIHGEGKAPVGLIEGVADYMILKSNYYPRGYAKRGQGDRWDQGYDFTARFLEYCDELKPGFVAELNKMMRYDYSDSFFQVLLGKPVDQLWADYKAKYPYHDG